MCRGQVNKSMNRLLISDHLFTICPSDNILAPPYPLKLLTKIFLLSAFYFLHFLLSLVSLDTSSATIFLQQTTPQVLKTYFFFVSLVSLDTSSATIFLQQTTPQVLKTYFFFVSLCDSVYMHE